MCFEFYEEHEEHYSEKGKSGPPSNLFQQKKCSFTITYINANNVKAFNSRKKCCLIGSVSLFYEHTIAFPLCLPERHCQAKAKI